MQNIKTVQNETINHMYDDMGGRFSMINAKFFRNRIRNFAEACGGNEGAFSLIIGGKLKPNKDIYRVLVSMPQINARWLLFGDGEMIDSSTTIVGDGSINAPNNQGEQHNHISNQQSDTDTIEELRHQLDVKDQQIKDLTANMQTLSDALLKMITANSK